MTEPQKALLGLGATVKLVGPESLANGWHGDAWGHYFPVDAQIATMLSADYDMLVVPGGARSLLKLSQSPHTKRIVTAFVDDQKPVALIGQGVEVLVITERAQGVTVAVPEESAPRSRRPVLRPSPTSRSSSPATSDRDGRRSARLHP